MGDVHGDGTPDVGALRESVDGTFQAGRAYAFSGSDGYILGALSSQNVEESGEFGYAVAGLGDLGNGGAPEVVVGLSSGVYFGRLERLTQKITVLR